MSLYVPSHRQPYRALIFRGNMTCHACIIEISLCIFSLHHHWLKYVRPQMGCEPGILVAGSERSSSCATTTSSNANGNMTLVAVEQLLSDSLADLASNPGLLERKDTKSRRGYSWIKKLDHISSFHQGKKMPKEPWSSGQSGCLWNKRTWVQF